jgi:hypothetical protein
MGKEQVMQTRIISVLLFMLVCTAIVLSGYTQVWAYCDGVGPNEIDLTDCCCTLAEKAEQLCIEIYNGDSQVDYVVQVFPDDFTPVPSPTYTWPISNNGNLTFQYRACVPEGTDCKGVPTWNYFVQRQQSCVAPHLVSTIPPGAQLLIPGQSVPKCPTFTASTGEHLLKLNPSLNCGYDNNGVPNEVVFSFTFTDDVQTCYCNYSVVTTKRGCEGGFLQGPCCEQGHSITSATTESTAGTTTVELDRCGSGPVVDDQGARVFIDGVRATACKLWMCFGGTLPFDPETWEDDGWTCFRTQHLGLDGVGCDIDGSRYYGYGADGYTR